MNDAALPGKDVNGGSLSPAHAMYVAWGSWLVMLTIPFVLFLFVVLNLGGDGEHLTGPLMSFNGWFWSMLVYLLLVVPTSFFWRGHSFRAYWSGHSVSPGHYLTGMLAVWIALEVGGLLSLVGCMYDKSLLPDLIPALVAFMFFVTMYPSGRAMVRHVGNLEDPEMYEEPR